MAQWDFTADLNQLLASVGNGDGPRSMPSMIQTAASLVERSRQDDPSGLDRWFHENAEALVGQQLLIANVHAHPTPGTELGRLLREWAAHSEDQSPAGAVEWLKQEHPGLLRAWLLSRVEDLIAEQLRHT